MRAFTAISVIYALVSTTFAYPSDNEHPGLWPPPDGDKEWNPFNFAGWALTQVLGPFEEAIQDINAQDKSDSMKKRSPSMPLSVVEYPTPTLVTVTRRATVPAASKTGIKDASVAAKSASYSSILPHSLHTSSTTKSVAPATTIATGNVYKTASSISASSAASLSTQPVIQDSPSWANFLSEVERAFKATIEAAKSGELFKNTAFHDQNDTNSDVSQIRDSVHTIVDKLNAYILSLLPEDGQDSHSNDDLPQLEIMPIATMDTPYHNDEAQRKVKQILYSIMPALTPTPTSSRTLTSSASTEAKSTGTGRRFPVAKRRLSQEEVSDLAPRDGHGMPGQWSLFFHFQDGGSRTQGIANHFGVKCQGMPGGKRFVTSFEWEDGMFVRGYRLYEDRQCTKPVAAGGDGTFYPRSVVLNKEVAAYMIY